MLGTATTSLTTTSVLALTGCILVVACSRREVSSGAVQRDTISVEQRMCAGDSLRPTLAAPASGLWVYEPGRPGGKVAALIGPPRPGDSSLVVTRPVESLEVTQAGDTIRYGIAAATVSLELLPPRGGDAPPDDSPTASAGAPHSAATYAPSRWVRLASYEPCAMSPRGHRIRYLRRDGEGQIVTDVMLHRESAQ